MSVKVVKITDPEIILQVRLDFLATDPLLPETDEAVLADSIRGYVLKHTAAGDSVVLAVTDGDVIVSIGFLTVTEMPPNGAVPNGRFGTLLNILTYPEHRRREYGETLVRALDEEARGLGVAILDLHATESGAPVYRGSERCRTRPMRMRLTK